MIGLLTTGEIGMRHQTQGLGEALSRASGLNVVEHQVTQGAGLPWCRAPLWWHRRVLAKSGLEPWSGVVISCGRRSVATALALKAQATANGQTLRAIHIQDPKVLLAHFDLCVIPRHDLRSAPLPSNVLVTTLALHGVTEARLKAAGAQFADRLVLPRPWLGVMLGQVSELACAQLMMGLERVVHAHGAGIALSTSRRTPEAVHTMLQARWGSRKDVRIHKYQEAGEDNPYLGILALADHIVVTGDSVSMVSEALASGKRVSLVVLRERGRVGLRFRQAVTGHPYCRIFDGTMTAEDFQPCPPWDETATVAQQIVERWGEGLGR